MNKLERTLLAKQHIEDVTKRFNNEISLAKKTHWSMVGQILNQSTKKTTTVVTKSSLA